MAGSPTTIALRAELNAAIQILDPQIRGLQDLHLVSLSTDTKAEILREINDHVRRRDACNTVIISLDNLENDGYPDMPLAPVTDTIMAELQQQMADFQAAFSEFTPLPQASIVTVTVPTPTDNL